MASSPNFLTSFDDTLPQLGDGTSSSTASLASSLGIPDPGELPISSGPSPSTASASSALSAIAAVGTGGELVDITDPSQVASTAGQQVAQSISGAEQAATATFFGSRFVAIALGLILIAGAILLFLGDDIAGAVKVAGRLTS